MGGTNSVPQDTTYTDADGNVTEVTYTREGGYGSRVMNSAKCACLSPFILLAAIVLLWTTEGVALRTENSLLEAMEAYETVSGAPNGKFDGKLIHLTDKLHAGGEKLVDSEFGLTREAVALKRHVEMYQWEEKKETTEKKKGDHKETVTTYKYFKSWAAASATTSTSSFHNPSGHENPDPPPFKDFTWDAKDVTLGAFSLSDTLQDKAASWWTPVVLDSKQFTEAESGKYLYFSRPFNTKLPTPHTGGDTLGDVRVSWQEAPLQTASVLARQQGSNLNAWPTSQRGYKIELLVQGKKSGDVILEDELAANDLMKWVKRIGGLLLMILGFHALLGWVSAVASAIPIVSSVASFGVTMVAVMLGLTLSLVVTALAWIAVRPLFAGAALGGAALLVAVLLMNGGGKAKSN